MEVSTETGIWGTKVENGVKRKCIYLWCVHFKRRKTQACFQNDGTNTVKCES